MAWHVFEKLLEGVANYSPFVGKIWITFLFIFRIIMVASVGDTVYGDEQSNFVCNTLQPGCENVCFNHFSPISQIRFWAVQILFVGTPSIVFIVYAMHKMSTLQAKKEKEDQQKDRTLEVKEVQEESDKSKPVYISGLPEYGDVVETRKESFGSKGSKESMLKNGIVAEVVKIPKKRNAKKDQIKRKTVFHKDGQSEVVKTASIARAYVAQAILRTAVEIVFLYLQYDMYKFTVDELYVCEGSPCPKVVDCFVSRPMEKTLFLRFMYAMSGLSLLLNAIELCQLFWNGVRHHYSPNSSFPVGAFQLDSRTEYYGRRRRVGRRGRGMRPHQTFPELGPFPRRIDNSYGDSSDVDSMDSDYRYYASN